MSQTIRQARASAALTQRELAELVEVSVRSVCAWEEGRHAPELGRVVRIAAACGVPPSFLLAPLDGLS